MNKLLNPIRRRMYNNILPMDYDRPVERFFNSVVLNKPELKEDHGQPTASYRTANNLWAQYLGIPHKDRLYKDPKDGLTEYNENGKIYYSINNPELLFKDIREATTGLINKYTSNNGDWYYEDSPQAPYGKNVNIKSNFILGDFQTMRKVDPKNGEYVQYSDRWDINPYLYTDNIYGQVPYQDMPWYDKLASKIVNKYILNHPDKDASFGLGNPLNIKGKIYMENIYGAPKGSTAPDPGDYFGGWLPEVIVHGNNKLSGFKNGKSPIHIKPANRGKLTALKKRTGKSEAELYKTGGPSVRKMITFARNARKWKH